MRAVPERAFAVSLSFLRKGEVLAYVGRIHNLKDLQEPNRVVCTETDAVWSRKVMKQSPVAVFHTFT